MTATTLQANHRQSTSLDLAHPVAVAADAKPSLPPKPTASRPFPLAAHEGEPQTRPVRVGDVVFGGEQIVVIGGPCSVESRDQIIAAAEAVRAGGGTVLRGGAYKPRTSPYDFSGLGVTGLEYLAEARERTGLPIITEVMDSEDVDLVAEYADILQIGARNMSAFRLLQRAARTGKPIMLKRGMQATIKEWLLAAEYVLAAGNPNLIICERGIRTFDDEYTRNCLDLNAVPVIKQTSHLPVVVDPSHGTGRADLVAPMAAASIAAGADALIVEVHPDPAGALCDGKQSLSPQQFSAMMAQLRPLADVLGRRL